jgi:hypothetical protein
MLEAFVIILILFQLKHWYIDFVDQTMDEVRGKGIYGNWQGIKHSLKHGLGTFICTAMVVDSDFWAFALVIGFIDFVTHYHIDWTKMNFGNRDIQTPAFWNHLGLDQMAHQLIYIVLGYMIVS